MQQELNALLLQHQEVFKGELGTLVWARAKIYVDLEAKPCYFKARWTEAHSMQAITANTTKVKSWTIFATHGIPAVLVSSNLVNAEFKHFLKKIGIKHITIAPSHP